MVSVAATVMPVQTQRPELVVLIAVDQLRGDYMDRWSTQLTLGLGFRNDGAFFPHVEPLEALDGQALRGVIHVP